MESKLSFVLVCCAGRQRLRRKRGKRKVRKREREKKGGYDDDLGKTRETKEGNTESA